MSDVIWQKSRHRWCVVNNLGRIRSRSSNLPEARYSSGLMQLQKKHAYLPHRIQQATVSNVMCRYVKVQLTEIRIYSKNVNNYGHISHTHTAMQARLVLFHSLLSNLVSFCTQIIHTHPLMMPPWMPRKSAIASSI